MSPIATILGAHLLAAPAAGWLASRAPRLAVATATVAHVLTLVVLASVAGPVLDGTPVRAAVEWAPGLDLVLSANLDALALVMSALVAAAGLLVVLYAAGYAGRGKKLGPLLAGLVAFAGAMQVVVLADDLLALFVGWELTSLTSYGLISLDHRKRAARDAARQSLLVTGAGGLALMAGLVAIGQATGTWTLSGLAVEGVPGGAFAVEAGVVLVAIAAATKSAQVPFSTWLPGAMAAPTPVSAYLHSATMVKAGVYLLLRMSPVLGDTRSWTPVVVTFGCTTLLVAGWRALQADDAKQLLAWSTVSQLGLLITAIGVGGEEVLLGVLALVLAHALAKAALFMAAGAVDVATGTRDLRRIRGAWRRYPVLGISVAIAGASLAGVPPMAGFVAKEAVLEGLLHEGDLGVAMAFAVAAGSALTVAYALRLLLAGAGPASAQGEPRVDAVRLRLLAWPAGALAAASVLLGWFSGVQDRPVGAALGRISEVTETPHLYLWHGLTPALGLSALAITGGAVLIWRLGAAHLPRIWWAPPEGTFGRSIDVLGDGARRLSAVVQSGSLPVYLVTMLTVLIIVPGIPLTAAAVIEGALPGGALQVGDAILAAAIALGAVVAARSSHRAAAVMALGAVGFGIALIFVRAGAPDLALTQLVVETLTLMLFVLALRELPPRFGPQPAVLSTASRWVLGAGVGSLVTTFTLVGVASRTVPGPGAQLMLLAEPEGGGKNVVNVILTDIRALDTVGEITVLLVAAIGIALLVQTGRAHGPSIPVGPDAASREHERAAQPEAASTTQPATEEEHA